MTSTPLLPAVDARPVEALRLQSVVKTYGSGANAVSALRGVDLVLAKGSVTAIMGPSGSGKSTLLHSAAGLDKPTSGSVHLGGTEISGLRASQLTAFRRDHVGFVFQAYNLLPALDVEENITLPLRLAGRRLDPRWLDSLLDAVGLADRVIVAPPSCRVDSSSASPSPARSSPGPTSCSVTSRPGHSIPARASRCSICSPTPRRSSTRRSSW